MLSHKKGRVGKAKQKCIKKMASEKESLMRSKRTNDQEPRCVMGDSISEVENAVNVATSLIEEKG